MKWESNEPLHLCVSSEFYDKFATACAEAEKLLVKIYKEYDSYLMKNWQRIQNLKVKKILNVPAKAIDSSLTTEESKFDLSSC